VWSSVPGYRYISGVLSISQPFLQYFILFALYPFYRPPRPVFPCVVDTGHLRSPSGITPSLQPPPYSFHPFFFALRLTTHDPPRPYRAQAACLPILYSILNKTKTLGELVRALLFPAAVGGHTPRRVKSTGRSYSLKRLLQSVPC